MDGCKCCQRGRGGLARVGHLEEVLHRQAGVRVQALQDKVVIVQREDKQTDLESKDDRTPVELSGSQDCEHEDSGEAGDLARHCSRGRTGEGTGVAGHSTGVAGSPCC